MPLSMFGYTLTGLFAFCVVLFKILAYSVLS